eukprot:scaffold22716_cov43-Cyclotella_meneghiniana.AAC.2
MFPDLTAVSIDDFVANVIGARDVLLDFLFLLEVREDRRHGYVCHERIGANVKGRTRQKMDKSYKWQLNPIERFEDGKEKTDASKDDPPGTPTKVIEPSPTEKENEDKPASTSNEEEDDDDDDDIYVDDEWGTVRKAMEAEGKGHMSIKDWMESWCPPSRIKGKSKDGNKKGAKDVGKKGVNKKDVMVEVSSASADDDSGNVKAGEHDVPQNVKAGEGVSVSTLSGSSVTSSVLTLEDEATKRRIDFWRFMYNKMTKMYKRLEAENVDLKRKTSRGRGSTKTVLDATDRQLLDEAKQGMREVSRHVKFQKPGWLSFSMRVGTVCQMVVRKISSQQPGMKEKDYMNCWYNVLVPHLPGVLQDLKNKMTQKYRGQHEKDYGTPNYISGDDL